MTFFPALLVALALSQSEGGVTVRTAPPPGPARTEVPSPMELTVPIPAKLGAGWAERKPRFGGSIVSTAQDLYVCDKAHLPRIQVDLTKVSKRGKGRVKVHFWIETGWYSQDVDLTFDLLLDGKPAQTKTYRELTIGSPEEKDKPFAGQPQALAFTWDVPVEQALAIGEGRAALRVTVRVDD